MHAASILQSLDSVYNILLRFINAKLSTQFLYYLVGWTSLTTR